MKTNVWIDPKGIIKVKLPKSNAGMFDLERNALLELEGKHPSIIASDVKGRNLLTEALKVKSYSLSNEVTTTFEDAIEEGKDMTTPITKVTDFERVAYCDDYKTLMCRERLEHVQMSGKIGVFTSGKRYRVTSWTYRFREEFTRNKTHFGDGFYSHIHQCRLDGKDKAYRVWFDNNMEEYLDFMEKPTTHDQRHLSEIWDIFDKPNIKTVSERFPAKIRKNLDTLDALEMIGGFEYYEGQRDYLARVGSKNHGYIVAEAGCGKSNFALSLIGMKGAKRSLIIAPQGTVKGESVGMGMSASQWAEEVEKFAPCMNVYELFSMKDYYKVLDSKGELPHGIYVTYFQALFHNGALENSSPKLTDGKMFKKALGADVKSNSRQMCHTIGDEVDGIRCIAKPSMATLIGDQFDMVCCDEAQIAQNRKSGITEALIRLQPKYRFAFSATPIPNDISNLFAVMGWLCVPEWYRGHNCNPAFPFTRQDSSRFEREYMSVEEDLTLLAWGEKKYKSKSPIVSSASHLVRILKATMSFISKADCNPNYRPPVITNVRVDMGKQQEKLYGHYMDRTNIIGDTMGVRATNQVVALRCICAEPYGSKYNEGKDVPVVISPFNPKLTAILELVQEKLTLGEQVTIISSRTSTSDMMQGLLSQCGIECARIDTKTSGKHSKEANRFKAGEVPVMLMGIKCAAAHSFSQCRNLIITSIEWSNGVFTQAIGRVDRINSPVPPNVYVILYKNSIEEVMYDMMTIRNDAATLCIKGEYPEPSLPIDIGEILAHSIVKWKDNPDAHDEMEYEQNWKTIRKDIESGYTKAAKAKRNVQVIA